VVGGSDAGQPDVMTSAPTPITPPSPEPDVPASAPPQLRRSNADRMLGGVCGGLAEYSRIDVTLWRIGFVVAALFGVGALIYLLLWIIMPPPVDGTSDRLGPVDKVFSDLHLRLTGRQAG
jgi:phage shock protein C